MHADGAALKSAVSAWARAIQDRLQLQYGGRFKADWTQSALPDSPAGAQTAVDYHQTIALTETGRPYARIVLTRRAVLPHILACDLESIQDPVTMGAALMRSVGILAGIAAFGGWVYLLFWAGGLGRVIERVTSWGACKGCATKLEFYYVIVAGWLLVPLMAAFAFIFAGELLDQGMSGVRTWLTRRKLEKKFLPWLVGAMRDVEVQASADSAAAQTFGIVPAIHQTAGTPHPVHMNVVWDGNGRMRPAEGFTWATDDPDSFMVKPKVDVPPV